MKLHFDLAGSGSPIVLTNGLGDSSEAWSHLFELLRYRWTVLKWDLRGHGRSESANDPADYSAELAVHDLESMISVAGATPALPAVLVGHSFGGYLSLSFAIRHPELIRALVLVSTGPGFRDEISRTKWNQYVQAIDLGSQVNAHARLLGLQSDGSVVAQLTSIQRPTLIIVGGEDHRFLGAMEYMAAKIPRATSVVIDGGRHSIHKTHSEEVNRVVLKFLETL